MLSLVGIGTFVFFFFGMQWSNARRWRQLAKSYAGDEPRLYKAKKPMQSAVLVTAGGFNSLHGILTLGVHDKGLSLSLMAPFSAFHTPLLIPFADIKIADTNWYLNAQSVEFGFRGKPDVRLVMSADQAEWISRASAGKMSPQTSEPQRQSPTGRWHAFTTISAGVSLIMAGWLVWLVVSGQLS